MYTKTGDEGQTSLVGGTRISKASSKVEAYGDVDELNAVLGIARTQAKSESIRNIIETIQNDLFIIGAELASPPGLEVPRIGGDRIKEIESAIDKFLEELEPLKEFILPSGSPGGACLHFARTVSRRAERKVVKLMEQEEVGKNVLVYINRLSDLLFVMARVENKNSKYTEIFVEFGKK